MGILANTVSCCQYQVSGDIPGQDLFVWVGERLALNGFRSIDRSADELSVGWVHLDDTQRSDFADEQTYRRDHWIAFALRRDQRRVPAAVLRAHYDLACRDFLAANPGLQRVPKGKRDELKEAIQGALLARTLAVPAVYDAIWDTQNGVVTFTSLSPKVTDLFESTFKQTFPGLALTPIAPFRRAEKLIRPELLPALQKANQASGDGLLELIRDNRWIGEDFLLWLLFGTVAGAGEYHVSAPGPAEHGEKFVAYLNDRMVLQGGDEGLVQKMTLSGPQDRYGEARAALLGGKRLREGVITFERQERLWRLNLKGETFAFASFKAPPVRLERDDLTDPVREREALFFERMHLLSEGEQLFFSLFADFLVVRLSTGWKGLEPRIAAWLQPG
jgi:hypothetical protein